MVLDEGGAVIDNPPLGVQGQFAVVGVAEKGIFNARIATSAEGGHAATPSLEDATAKLVAGLDALQKNPPASKLSAPVAAMLRELAARGGFGLRLVFGNLWLFRPLVIRIMQGGSETAAMVRTTYALTQLEGSPAHNVIPKQARATVNVRVDPGEDGGRRPAARIKDRFDDRTQSYELFEVSEPSPIVALRRATPRSTTCAARSSRACTPTAGIAPYVQSSCSDARHFAPRVPAHVPLRGHPVRGRLSARASTGRTSASTWTAYKRGVGFYTEFIRHLDRLGK